MSQINIHEAKTHLSRLVKEAAQGKEIIIAIAGKPIAKLVPLSPAVHRKRKPGKLKGKLWIADDFDAPMTEAELAEWYEAPLFPEVHLSTTPKKSAR